MNIRYSILSFLISLFFPIMGQKNNQELFLQAVRLQQDKKYDQALAAYEHINPKGRAVLYNMGLNYYALNQFPQALAYLQRAQQNAPIKDYTLITNQIAHINNQLGKPAYASFWYTFFARFVSGISLLMLQILFLTLWYFLWLCFLSKQKKRRRIFLFTLCSILFVMSGIGLFVKASLQRYTGGVIVEKEASLRVGPQSDYEAVDTLVSADQVTIIKKVDNWYLVKSGSKRGWIPKEALIPINE